MSYALRRDRRRKSSPVKVFYGPNVIEALSSSDAEGKVKTISQSRERGIKMEQTQTAAAVLPVDWLSFTMEVSKKVSVGDKNEYQKVGDVTVNFPLLAAFGFKEAKLKRDEKGEIMIGEDGLPMYEDPAQDWLFGAALAAVKAQTRNKLISGTADLKEGQKISATMDELIAEGERKGNAEALKLAKEIAASFASFVQGLGKSQATQAVLIGLFRNVNGLSIQDAKNKEKFKGYLSQFAETLEEADLTRYSKYLTKLEDACSTQTPEDF